MKTLLALSACAVLAASAPVFAQNNANEKAKGLEQNASPSGVDPSHAKQPSAADTEAGPAMKEGRSSANDAGGTTASPTPGSNMGTSGNTGGATGVGK